MSDRPTTWRGWPIALLGALLTGLAIVNALQPQPSPQDFSAAEIPNISGPMDSAAPTRARGARGRAAVSLAGGAAGMKTDDGGTSRGASPSTAVPGPGEPSVDGGHGIGPGEALARLSTPGTGVFAGGGMSGARGPMAGAGGSPGTTGGGPAPRLEVALGPSAGGTTPSPGSITTDLPVPVVDTPRSPASVTPPPHQQQGSQTPPGRGSDGPPGLSSDGPPGLNHDVPSGRAGNGFPGLAPGTDGPPNGRGRGNGLLPSTGGGENGPGEGSNAPGPGGNDQKHPPLSTGDGTETGDGDREGDLPGAPESPSPSPTPEPISVLLVGAGLAGAYKLRRYLK